MPIGVYIRTKPNHWIGRKHTKEAKQKMSVARLGKPLSRKTKERMRESSHKGEDAYNWKGNSVGYGTLHMWVNKNLGRPMQCSHCGRVDKRSYDWANLSHEYKRELSDWVRLCRPCHRQYDYGNIDMVLES